MLKNQTLKTDSLSHAQILDKIKMDVFGLIDDAMIIVVYIKELEEAAKTANNRANLQSCRKIITLNLEAKNEQ